MENLALIVCRGCKHWNKLYASKKKIVVAARLVPPNMSAMFVYIRVPPNNPNKCTRA